MDFIITITIIIIIIIIIIIFLEWKIVVGQRRFTSGHRTVGEEEDDRNYHEGTRRRTSWRAETWKKIWQKIDRHLWRLGVDGRLLAV